MTEDEKNHDRIEHEEDWLALKRQSVGWVRQRAPGLVIGMAIAAVIATLIAAPLILGLLGVVVGGYAGQALLGDLSFLLKTPSEKAHKNDAPKSESGKGISRQEMRAAAVEKMAVGAEAPTLPANYHTDTVNSRRAPSVAAPNPSAPPL